MPENALDSIVIDRFRGLRKLTLDGLGPINILVGANNSGKTSVLEAISILCNPYHPSEWIAMVRRRDFGGLDETRVQSLRWCFPQTGDLADPELLFQSQCEMSCTGRFPLRKLVAEYTDIVREPSSQDMHRPRRSGERDIIEIEEQWRGAEITHHVEAEPERVQSTLFDSGAGSASDPIVMQYWEDSPRIGRPLRSGEGNLPTETLTPYSYQLNRLQVRSHSQQLFATKNGLAKGRHLVLELIREFDPEIVDIGVASLRGKGAAVYVDHARLGPAPLSIFGDALRRAVLLANTLHNLKGGVLLIDEVETGIHVSALERVFAWLANAARRFDVQVFATTHSLEAVDAIAQSVTERIEDVVTFHLDQTEDETRVKRIAGHLLFRLRHERGLDVR